MTKEQFFNDILIRYSDGKAHNFDIEVLAVAAEMMDGNTQLRELEEWKKELIAKDLLTDKYTNDPDLLKIGQFGERVMKAGGWIQFLSDSSRSRFRLNLKKSAIDTIIAVITGIIISVVGSYIAYKMGWF